MSPRQRPTLHDVAERAGVSYQTVSRVINQQRYVADDTRARVLTAIAELGFRPNRAAQSLAGNRSRTLGMITFGINQYGPAQMMIHIEQAARAAKYDLIFANVNDTSMLSMRAAIETLLHWQIDGLLCVTPVAGVTYDDLRLLCGAMPIVQIGSQPGAESPSAVIDQAHGVRLAAEHLLTLGHRQFAEIRGPADWIDAHVRHETLVAALAAAGATLAASHEGDWTADSGYRLTQQMLHAGAAFTALVAANDQMALGALMALRERGVGVPEQISVVGYDDIPEAVYFAPPLTTVRQNFAQLGRDGIEYLLEWIHTPDTPIMQRTTQPALVVRGSTGVVSAER
ncbi:MAG: substrate-binding domain-containing protein [Chloroflexota bacterium]|nr:substrate-binding domain-containing protein [Chloroflexota bacterium]